MKFSWASVILEWDFSWALLFRLQWFSLPLYFFLILKKLLFLVPSASHLFEINITFPFSEQCRFVLRALILIEVDSLKLRDSLNERTRPKCQSNHLQRPPDRDHGWWRKLCKLRGRRLDALPKVNFFPQANGRWLLTPLDFVGNLANEESFAHYMNCGVKLAWMWIHSMTWCDPKKDARYLRSWLTNIRHECLGTFHFLCYN